jgi:benzoate membrane transport protein
MTVGIGNVQGLGMLLAKGYRPPVNLVTAVIGVASIVNAVFGGHQATVARNGIAILAAEDAGPAQKRYVANLVATLFLLVLALNSAVAHSLLDVLPGSLVAALAGLAILNSLLEALRKSISTDLPLGSFFALAIAASPLAFFGVGSAFWALVGGLAVSALLERPGLRRSISEEAEPS